MFSQNSTMNKLGSSRKSQQIQLALRRIAQRIHDLWGRLCLATESTAENEPNRGVNLCMLAIDDKLAGRNAKGVVVFD
jgi:hypothetical protein